MLERRLGEYTRSARLGLIVAWAMLGIAAILFFTEGDDRDASVETATGSRETVVAVDDLEEDVAEQLGAWDIPERGTDRPLRVVASDVRWRDGADQRWLTVERVSASLKRESQK